MRWSRLAEAHNARVFVAPDVRPMQLSEDHRLFAGFLPAMREKIVGLLDGADLVFAIGAPAFTYHVEGCGPHVPPGAKLVQLTDDPQTAAWTPKAWPPSAASRLGLTRSACAGDAARARCAAARRAAAAAGRSRRHR